MLLLCVFKLPGRVEGGGTLAGCDPVGAGCFRPRLSEDRGLKWWGAPNPVGMGGSNGVALVLQICEDSGLKE